MSRRIYSRRGSVVVAERLGNHRCFRPHSRGRLMFGENIKILYGRTFLGRLVMKSRRVTVQLVVLLHVILGEIKINFRI